MKLFHVCFFVDGQYHCCGLDYDNLDLVGIWHLLCCSQVSNSSTPIFFLLRIFFLSTLILNQSIEFPHQRYIFSVRPKKQKLQHFFWKDSGFRTHGLKDF